MKIEFQIFDRNSITLPRNSVFEVDAPTPICRSPSKCPWQGATVARWQLWHLYFKIVATVGKERNTGVMYCNYNIISRFWMDALCLDDTYGVITASNDEKMHRKRCRAAPCVYGWCFGWVMQVRWRRHWTGKLEPRLQLKVCFPPDSLSIYLTRQYSRKHHTCCSRWRDFWQRFVLQGSMHPSNVPISWITPTQIPNTSLKQKVDASCFAGAAGCAYVR